MYKISWRKIRNKIRGFIIRKLRGTAFLPFLYRSYWHCLFVPISSEQSTVVQYYTARPNPGAGIGHQIANWHAGLWYAHQFGLNHVHLPFSSKSWDYFLGYGEGEMTMADLKEKGYKVRRLPFFFENTPNEVRLNKRIISSYSGQKIVFLAEQDQRYDIQYGVIDEIQRKFYNAPSRKEDNLIYNKGHFNIAIHVRRGDIMEDPSLSIRYLSNDYYFKVLKTIVNCIKSNKEKHIYFFSQGIPEDYPEFKVFENLHWCLDMNAQESFLHMVYADILITSKSSFSYKPALLSKGIKVCPANFWHSYPKTQDWILFDDEGGVCNPSSLKILNSISE